MQNFVTALKAEHLKKKGTGMYVLAIILGIVSPVIMGLEKIFEPGRDASSLPFNYYVSFVHDSIIPFCTFFFPLLIIITVSRITQLDHRNGGWQLMETQPVRKWSIYFSKFTVILITNLIAIIALIAASYLVGWILTFVKDLPKSATTDFAFSELFWIMARLFITALFLSALQYAVSVIMPSFIWSILIGFFLLLLYLFLTVLKVVPHWYPLELMAQVSSHPKGSQLGYWLTYSETVSALAAVLLLYTGFEWYRYKSFKRAFLSQPASFAKWAIILLVFGGLLAYTVSPKTMEPYTKTVITGKIESNIPFSKAYLTDNFIKDTIAIIPIKNNQFNFSIPQDMPLANYTVNFDEMYNVSFIMGNKDSIYIDMQVINKDSKVTVTGTRLAENQYAKDLYTWSSVSYYIEQNMFIDKPDYISDELVSDWKDAIKESDNFRTVDNYIPGEDYLKKRQILSTIEYLNYWNTFKKKRAAMYPDAKTVDTEGIKEMKALVPLNDESLLSEKSYFDYIKTGLIAPNKEDIDEDTKSLLAITKLPKGKFRDKMLYWQLNESLKGASATSERDKLLAQYNSEYTNKKFSTYTTTNYKLIESLGKGKPAPLFDAVTLDNKPFNLADLKGKHVVIDTWATWCAPCREQSPLFEKMAIKYKGQPVQFAAVSIDRKIDDWFADAKTKSKSVLQLHINNEKKFSKEYDITGIPRFILIDPQGNYVESAMPYPNDHLFEKMLRDALKLPEEK